MFRTLIAADELKAHVGDDGWAIVDARFYLPEPDRGAQEYLDGHVAGAVYAHLDRDLSGARTGTNGRHPMPAASQLVDRFSAWGIDDDVQVVAYDTAGGMFAARLWWQLRYLGHDAAAVLDGAPGALDALPKRSGAESRAPRTFTPRVRDEMRVDVDDVAAAGGKAWLLLDARAPERYRGESEPLDPVAGHIPGARNVPCGENLTPDGRFAAADVLRARLEPMVAGRDPRDIVSYCGSGVTACHNLLALEQAGIHGAKLYPGSWSEWCAEPSRPVATGDE